MYSQLSNDEEEQPILGRGRHGGKSATTTSSTTKRLSRGILLNRILLLLLLTAVTVAGWYFQTVMLDVQGQLWSEQEKIATLQDKIAVHEQTIERFNSSITNTDVMNHLNALQKSFQETEQELHDELASTKADINAQLQETVSELSTTVTEAEAEIQDQVDKVKKDVEHYVVTTQDQFSMENSFMVYQLAGTFTLLSCLISMWHMTAHLRKLNQPDVQRRILAILWMSPVYAVTSWFSLVFHSAEGYLAIVKDGYEAYIIYQFLSFCIAVLGKGDRNKVVDLLAFHADHLTPPFRLFGCCEYVCKCCQPEPYENNRALADAILLQCQFFALQFVLFRPLTTTAMVVLGKLEYYGAGDGPSDYRSPQFYITIVQNLSIFIAFTGLLKFYHAVDKELAWCRPFAKFLCIKGVVFMTFWQGLAISILAQITDVAGQDEQEWAKSAQNFLICLEMLLFSIAHFHCFPTDEWEEGYRVKHQQSNFGDSIALGDFFQDVKLILENKPARKKKKRPPPSAKKASSRKLAVVVEANGEENEGMDNLPAEEGQEVPYDRSSSSGTTELDSDNEEAASQSQYASESSFDDSHTREFDSEDDLEKGGPPPSERKGFLSSHYHLMNEHDRKIARELEKSLGEVGDDPEIAEATRRLLESNVLSADFFTGDDDDDHDDDETKDAYRLYGAATDSFDDGESGVTDSDDDDDDNDDDDGGQDLDEAVSVDDGDEEAEEEDGEEEGDDGKEDEVCDEHDGMPPETKNDSDSVKTPERRKERDARMPDDVYNTPDKDIVKEQPPSDTQPERALIKSNSSVEQSNAQTSEPEIVEPPIPGRIDPMSLVSRSGSEGGFWAFDGNGMSGSAASTVEPAPLPTPNESTPLMNRKNISDEHSPNSSTPLKPSIFTTVAALAEASDDDDGDMTHAIIKNTVDSPKK